ncbi:M12 family metallopeptidase [Autumnicola psychrophila]|uniref:M12 family metallopeptidase n=1 Tax=Autumnicola psychrophila TaxID=3075592 RepID=A0ABU3DSH4_9FLAO|nr:M12 family metallopeptidase [Zunongwangia sp. F225]MDT0686675.1 M12 family metallopeptidase [Zunongwangia sp. F225]
MRKLKALFLLPVLGMLACSEDPISEIDVTTPNSTTEVFNQNLTEKAYPKQLGTTSQVYFAGQKLPVEEIKGSYVYQGDIILPKDMTNIQPKKLVYQEGETPQKSTGRTSGLWTDNTIYFQVDSDLSNQERVYDAIKHWESNTSLDFVERSGESDYIYFTSGAGCASYIGKIGGRQEITLASGCSTGNTIHEIGHAVGLWHEQSRVDRDRHVNILYENIESGREHNFETYEEMGYDGEEFTTDLDFNSIMMYSSYSFSKNGQPTIVRNNGSAYSVQRNKLSSGDVKGIESMYPSSSAGTEKPTEETYLNGEYYTVSGLTVLRYNDSWYYGSRFGWRKVKLVDSNWYWV